MRHTARLLDSTIVISLLQPEPQVVALFDDVIVMSEGRVIWQGPAEKVGGWVLVWFGLALVGHLVVGTRGRRWV